jgi:23S rRNA (pseudouridine1915-N3)-methyltransferase
MRILLLAVGKAKPGPELDLAMQYAARLPWTVETKEIAPCKDAAAEVRKSREAAALLAKVPDGSLIVALDENGTADSSQRFAKRLGQWRDAGTRSLAFLIGGADGHGAAALRAARHRLSLGPMTWPHLLVRGLLLEQLYRAHSILAGHPYHRG